MSIIKILSENLVNQIAAGEVIERPASVVKELIENSIDAKAKKITVELEEAGKKLIKISDDGKGISEKDLELAIQRHATSKISEEKDLWGIHSLGFRGEALASICSVSKVKISSKTEQENLGQKILVEGGKIIEKDPVQMNSGTKIEVSDLFFNTPARKKYLKKDSTELRQITSLFNNFALAHPEIHFCLKHNGKLIYDLTEVGSLEARIYDIFGNNTAEAMLPIFYNGPEFKLSGFIGKPVISRSSSQNQYLFVNKRSIQHHLLANRIKAAYHSMLMEHKKPFFILNIEIDPALIDVNVHPRKIEIRFEDEKSLISILYRAIKMTLDKAVLIPKGFSESRNYMHDGLPKNSDNLENFPPEKVANPARVAQAMDFSEKFSGNLSNFSKNSLNSFSQNPGGNFSQAALSDFSSERISKSLDRDEDFRPNIQAIVQIANSYIVAQNEDGLILIDQHAAHERVRFEELINQFENQKKSVQKLLSPFNFELSKEEISLLEENLHLFEELGFEISNFGGNSFMVYAVPSFFVKEDLEEVIKGVLDDLKEGKFKENFENKEINDEMFMGEKKQEISKLQGKNEEILTYLSCRSAIKFGQNLSLREMQDLINQMENLQRPYTCPHGRPTMIALNFQELEKMFGRK